MYCFPLYVVIIFLIISDVVAGGCWIALERDAWQDATWTHRVHIKMKTHPYIKTTGTSTGSHSINRPVDAYSSSLFLCVLIIRLFVQSSLCKSNYSIHNLDASRDCIHRIRTPCVLELSYP